MRQLRTQTASARCARPHNVPSAALAALLTQFHMEEREARHDIFKRRSDTLIIDARHLLGGRACVLPLLLRFQGLRSASVLRRGGRGDIGQIITLTIFLRRGIFLRYARLLLLTRAAHAVHEYKRRRLLHIYRQHIVPSCKRRNGARRLNQINLRMIARAARTQDTCRRKVQDRRRRLNRRQEPTSTANLLQKCRLLRRIGGTECQRVTLISKNARHDLAPQGCILLLVHRRKHPEGIQERRAKRPLCGIHRADRRIGNGLGTRKPVALEVKQPVRRTAEYSGKQILAQEIDLVHIEHGIAGTVQNPVPHTARTMLQSRLHIDRAEDHIFGCTERELHNMPRLRKGCRRTDEHGLCRATRT